MNNHQKGYRRDRLVLETLTEWGTMDTEQLRLMFYPSLQVARRRLRIMTSKGRVKRTREAVEQSYCYCMGKYDRERLALNWLRLWVLQRLKSWETLEMWDYATGMATIRNNVTNAVKTINVLCNATRKTWISGETVIVYDTEEQRREAAKRIKGTLLTIDEIREGLQCSKCS